MNNQEGVLYHSEQEIHQTKVYGLYFGFILRIF